MVTALRPVQVSRSRSGTGSARATPYRPPFQACRALAAFRMSGVTQNRPVKVEIKGFKTSHFLEQKTAPRNCPDAGPMGHVERPQSEPSGNDLHLRRPWLVPAAYSPRAGDQSRDSRPVFAVSKTSHFDPRHRRWAKESVRTAGRGD